MKMVGKMLGYLRRTIDYKLKLGPQSGKCGGVVLYTDSDWAGDPQDRKSQSGYVVLVNGRTVGWGSHKQDGVAASATGAEYVAMSDGAPQALLIRSVASDLGLVKAEDKVALLCDNMGAIFQTRGRSNFTAAKHVEIRHHHVRDLVEKGELTVDYVKSGDNLADIFTKGLKRPAHEQASDRLGIGPWGGVGKCGP